MKEKIYEYLLKIPKGRVVTYAQIGDYLGNRYLARYVGRILHQNPDGDKYPCYKVVNAQGKLASGFVFGGIAEQKRRLESEGIRVDGDRVNLFIYKWQGEE